jgi:predicted regulator of Ras-like GTPase activity (Roadblock/LC7/MglB family)
MEHLRHKVPTARAVILVGSGGVIDHLTTGQAFDVDAFAAEYATLLRIARRTSHDAGTGDLIEHVVVSEKSVIVARNVLSEYFLLVVASDRAQLGRARHELKRVARELERIL